MAKTGIIERDLKREKMIKSQSAKRAKLAAVIKDTSADFDEKLLAMKKLSEMPRNGSRTRLTRRCALTGRSRAVYRKFKLGRSKFRDLASMGQLPGVTKASW